MTNFMRTTTNVAAGLSLMGGLVMGAGPASARVMCGDTIGVDTPKHARLTMNLSCETDPALTLTSRASLDMRRFTLTCLDPNDGSYDGIVLEGSKASLRNGTVTGCKNGVILAGTGSHHVRKVTSTDNREDGFKVLGGSDRNRLLRNTGSGNSNDRFELNSNDNRLLYNLADGNGEGIEIQAGSGNQTIWNRIVNNGEGIDINSPASSNTLFGNFLHDNIASGIDVFSDGNRITGNDVAGNGFVGIRVNDVAQDNVLTFNRSFDHEDFDLVDENADCDNNVWRRNRFDTADPVTCID